MGQQQFFVIGSPCKNENFFLWWLDVLVNRAHPNPTISTRASSPRDCHVHLPLTAIYFVLYSCLISLIILIPFVRGGSWSPYLVIRPFKTRISLKNRGNVHLFWASQSHLDFSTKTQLYYLSLLAPLLPPSIVLCSLLNVQWVVGVGVYFFQKTLHLGLILRWGTGTFGFFMER